MQRSCDDIQYNCAVQTLSTDCSALHWSAEQMNGLHIEQPT